MQGKLHPHPVGGALAVVAGIIYVVCAAAVKLWPTGTVQFFGDWFHGIDITKIAGVKALTFGAFVRGLLEVLIFAYLVGALYAWVYNRCVVHCKRKGWIKA